MTTMTKDRAPRPQVAPRAEMRTTLYPRALTQHAAAQYLSVSVRYFRDNVHVEPKSVNNAEPGKKPLVRYRIEDLDAWLDECAGMKPNARVAR
jgi:hypothetical protein